jgi:hypothetical protein
MDIRIVNKGQTLPQVLNRMAHDVQRATRRVGGEIADAGSSAIEANAPTWDGRRLGVHTETHASGETTTVEFRGTPAGPWTILESGARPHIEKPHHREALKFGGRYAEYVRHPGVRGQRRWTKATARLERVVVPVVEDTYLQALH